jgi:hypothetical protein
MYRGQQLIVQSWGDFSPSCKLADTDQKLRRGLAKIFYESSGASGASKDVPPNDWQTNLAHSSVLMDPQPHVR